MDVSSDEAAKTYIWKISVRLAGYSGEELTCVADTLNRLFTAPIPMVWTMSGPAATQSSEEYSYLDLLRSGDPPCFAKHLNEKPQIIALLISFFPLLCIPPMVNKMLLNAATFLLIQTSSYNQQPTTNRPLFDRHITMIMSPWSIIQALIKHEIAAASLNSILFTCLPKWFR